MAAYKDEKRGTWFVSFHYNDWTGKNCRKVKRGFKTRREAVEWEQHFLMKEGSDLDMTFSEFVAAYTRDMQPKLKHNTWLTKEHIVRTKLLPHIMMFCRLHLPVGTKRITILFRLSNIF